MVSVVPQRFKATFLINLAARDMQKVQTGLDGQTSVSTRQAFLIYVALLLLFLMVQPSN